MAQNRGVAPVGRQGPSRSSIGSRQASNANVAKKYGSEVSLTPSQARQGGVENPRKSPLDALSRTSYRPNDPFQRRSGLQDVDDSFLANNAFARPARVRNAGMEGSVGSAAPAIAPLRVASGQEMQMPMSNVAPGQVQMQQQPTSVVQQPQPVVQQQQQQLPAATAVMPAQQAMPPQQQQPQPYVQPPAAGQPTRHEPYTGGRAHVHQHHQPQQQQQLPPQTQQQVVYETQQQQQAPPPQMELQAQVQQPPVQQQQQQAPPAQLSPRKYAQQQQQQGYANQPAAAASAVPPAAEMCTTCPNCQTTIYLVRSPEMGNGDGGLPMQ